MRQYAAIAAQALCVGAPGEPWPFAKVWGPRWQRDASGHITDVQLGRHLVDYEPDLTPAEWATRAGRPT